MKNEALLLGLYGGGALALLTIVGGLFFYFARQKSFIKDYFDADFFVGFMLSASAFGLILPAFFEMKERSVFNLFGVTFSLIMGAMVLIFIQKFFDKLNYFQNTKSKKSLAFFIAMAVHNLPEGLAAGASLSHAQSAHTYSLVSAIGLQNIPEGFTTGLSLFSLGIQPWLAFFGVVITALVELIGGLLGGLLNFQLNSLFPFILAFAGGAMMKIAISEIFEKMTKYDLQNVFNKNFIIGFSLMALLTI